VPQRSSERVSPLLWTDDDAGRPWGERTRRQRIITYSLGVVFAFVCLVLWATNTVELETGVARYGEVAFAFAFVVLSVKLWRELRG
jgi:hypothetical protein